MKQDIQLKPTPTVGLFKWKAGKLTGNVFISPYWDSPNSWVTWDDAGDRQILEKRLQLFARDQMAINDPRD